MCLGSASSKEQRTRPYAILASTHEGQTGAGRWFEAAQLMIGHSSAMVTNAVYAERDMSKVVAIAMEVG